MMFSSSLLVTMMTGVVGRTSLILGRVFEARHAGHHLVKDDQIVGIFGRHVDGVVAVVAGVDLIALLLEEEDMRFEQFDFVVDPEYFDHASDGLGITKLVILPSNAKSCALLSRLGFRVMAGVWKSGRPTEPGPAATPHGVDGIPEGAVPRNAGAGFSACRPDYWSCGCMPASCRVCFRFFGRRFPEGAAACSDFGPGFAFVGLSCWLRERYGVEKN